MKRIFVDKEKMLEKKYVDILEEIAIKYYKGFEHEKIKEVSGKEVDKLLKDMEDYIKRLKELRVEIEKRSQERTIEQIYNDVFGILKSIFGNKAQSALVADFENKLVKAGKVPQQYSKILHNIIGAKTEFKKGKLSIHKLEDARKEAAILINSLIEYSQRCDLVLVERGRMRIKYHENGKDAVAELLLCNNAGFLFRGNTVKKVSDKIENSSMDEVSSFVESQKTKKTIEINPKIFENLRKELGDYEIVY
jgi:hypothetical protein